MSNPLIFFHWKINQFVVLLLTFSKGHLKMFCSNSKSQSLVPFFTVRLYQTVLNVWKLLFWILWLFSNWLLTSHLKKWLSRWHIRSQLTFKVTFPLKALSVSLNQYLSLLSESILLTKSLSSSIYDESGKGGICISGCDDANFLVEMQIFQHYCIRSRRGRLKEEEDEERKLEAVDQNVKVFSGASITTSTILAAKST